MMVAGGRKFAVGDHTPQRRAFVVALKEDGPGDAGEFSADESGSPGRGEHVVGADGSSAGGFGQVDHLDVARLEARKREEEPVLLPRSRHVAGVLALVWG